MATRLVRLFRRLFVEPVPEREPLPTLPDLPEPRPSLGLAVELSKEAINHQIDTADALDTKAGFVLASASLLVAVLVVWHPPTAIRCSLAICREQIIPHAWLQVTIAFAAWLLLLASLVVYGLVIYFAGRAYSLRDFNNPPKPSRFVAPYEIPGHDQPGYALLLPEDVARFSLFEDMYQAHANNAYLIEEKVQWLRRALATFWIEASIVGLVIIYETVIVTNMK